MCGIGRRNGQNKCPVRNDLFTRHVPFASKNDFRMFNVEDRYTIKSYEDSYT